MLIPHFHFRGDCKEAITLYEKAFCSKAEAVITSREYGSNESGAENRIAHAIMRIHGQKVFLNDRFGKKDTKTDIALHMIVTFASTDELLFAYEILKEGCTMIDPLEELPYSALAVQFIDRHGVQWGFMVDEST